MKTNTLAVAYGAARFAARLGRRRAGPGPEARPRPLVLAEADFLLFLIISSSVISRAADIFGCERERGEERNRILDLREQIIRFDAIWDLSRLLKERAKVGGLGFRRRRGRNKDEGDKKHCWATHYAQSSK